MALNKTQLSLIVPCYNVEAYLRECLDSLVNQTITEGIEIICVNDGSTDNSLSILENYAQEHSFINVITQKNGGLSAARNTGIKVASGEYIAFLDSDDYVENTYFEKMLKSANENNSDIVICDFTYFFEDAKEKSYLMEGLNKKYPSLNVNKRAIISSMFAWNKIYRRSFFNEYGKEFVVGTWYEDIEIISVLFAKANTISYVNEGLIYYRQRSTSIMGTKSKRCEELFGVMDRTYEKFKEYNLLKEYHDEIEYLFIEQLLIYGQFRFLLMDNYKELVERCRTTVKKHFSSYLANKYYKDQSFKYRILVLFNNKFTCGMFRKYLVR